MCELVYTELTVVVNDSSIYFKTSVYTRMLIFYMKILTPNFSFFFNVVLISTPLLYFTIFENS